MKNLPSFIVDGKCRNDGTKICNLGYACDGCPYYRFPRNLPPVTLCLKEQEEEKVHIPSPEHVDWCPECRMLWCKGEMY